jgi:hypothetical protein
LQQRKLSSDVIAVGSHPAGEGGGSTVDDYRKRFLVIGRARAARVDSKRGAMAYKVFFCAVPENQH